MPVYVWCPLVSAAIYGFAALALKRATVGVGPWRVTFVVNWLQACLFSLLYLLPAEGQFSTTNLWHAIVVGFTFFVGQVFTFLALSRGDVSVATPVLGTKVVFVAAFVAMTGMGYVPPAWWVAAGLVVASTALMSGGGKTVPGQDSFLRSLLYGFCAAISFSLTDILSQRWAPAWGFTHFAPTEFFTVAVLSFGLIPFFRGRLRDLPAANWRWLLPGAALLSLQAGGIAIAIMKYQQATLVNILYGSRGLWSVLLVWLLGHHFGNEERSHHGHAVMVRRLCGSGLLLVAIVLAVKR